MAERLDYTRFLDEAQDIVSNTQCLYYYREFVAYGMLTQIKKDIDKIDKFCEEHWEEYFKSRSDMKNFKGWLKKAMEE